MKKWKIGLAGLGLMMLAIGATPAQFGKKRFKRAGRNGWFQDYQNARALAEKTGKPMMLVFRCVP